MEHKRPREAEGDGDHGHKAPRVVADAMAALDIRVVNRLDDMVAAGQIVHGDLDAKALGDLSQFGASDALQILDQFQHSGLENVRNKSAYLHGVMVRYKKDAGPRLEPDIDARLDRLFRSGKVKAADLDSKVYEALNQIPPPIAARVIDRFQAKVSEDVRNVSAFFISLLRQEQQNAGYDPRNPGAPPGPPGGGYGSYHEDPAPRYQRQYDQYPEPYPEPYPDDRYGGPPPRMPPPHHPGPHHHPPPPGHGPPAGGPQVLVISPDQLQQLQQPSGTVSLQALLPQILAAIQQQQQPAAPQHVPVPPPQPYIPAAPVQPSYQAGPGGRKSYAVEQAAMGVRVTEFHGLSYFSECVHPAPALKLQQLWDGGNRLVSLLDDRTWEALAQLPAPEALAVIDQVVENMKRQELRNPNAFFMSCAKKFLEKSRAAEAGSYSQQYPGPSPRPYAPNPPAAGRGPSSRAPMPRTSSGSGGSALPSLPDHMQRLALEAIAYHHPVLTESMFDEGVVEYMKRLSEQDAIGVFEELMGADLSNVRNGPAYLMGMIRKRRQEGGPATRRQ